MDMLAGYGSDSDSEHTEEEAPNGRAAPLTTQGTHTAAAEGAAAPASTSSLLDGLPVPAASKPPLFSGLPKPAAAQRKKAVVQFRVPISYGPPPDKLDEEEPARKRRKGGSQGMSLAQLLPPPKNAAAGGGGGQRLDTTTTSDGSKVGGTGRRGYDSDDDEYVPGTEDRSGMVDLRPGERVADDGPAAPGAAVGGEAAGPGVGLRPAVVDAAPAPVGEMHPSEAYRVAAVGGQQYTYFQAAAGGRQQQQYQQQQYHHQQPADPAEALLAQALEAEAARAARRGQAPPFAAGAAGPGAAGGITFKEIRADDVKYMDPSARAEVDAVRNALGADYEAKLRAQAGAAPTRLARSRHQIGSLFHQAKLAELQDMEVRAQSSKTKAESKRKYGW